MANILNLPPGSWKWLLVFAMVSTATAVQASTGESVSGRGHHDFHLSPDSGMSYEEELKLFEKEEAEEEKRMTSGGGHEHLSRKKRFVYLNVDTNMAVALLVGIPLTFVLPSMSNLFSSWRRKRSIDDSTMNSWTIPDDDSASKPEMDKVNTYFQLLNIPEPSCQLRAVCEFSADPEKFYPLSDVILKRIRNPHLPALVYLEGQESNSSLLTEGRKDQTSLYDMYNQAADFGQINGYDKCIERFQSSCHYPIEKLLNMPVIRFWSALQTLLKVSFRDVALK